jgi:hypothetical protein
MLIFAIIIILGLIFYPYIFMLISNGKMLSKLRRIAEREAYRIIPLRKFLWLPKHNSGGYDFLIDGRGQVMAVKLVSAVHKNFLIIRTDSSATASSIAREPMEIHSGKKENKKWNAMGKPIKISEIKENFNTEQGKIVEKTLLVYPPFAKIIFFDGKTEAELHSGDTVFSHTIYTPYGLEQKMCASSKALPSSND